jgi:hypothetical protein
VHMNAKRVVLGLVSLIACGEAAILPSEGNGKVPDRSAPLAPEVAPAASARLPLPATPDLEARVQTFFEGHAGRRIHVQTDRPLYRPGETLWLRVWDLAVRDLAPAAGEGVILQLVSPKGATVIERRVKLDHGVASADLELPADVPGGEYVLRAHGLAGESGERPVIVAGFESPRVKKKLEFLRKAYGPGDEVTATVEVKRATGEVLAAHPLTGAIRLDGADLPRVQVDTDASGAALVRFRLPASIEAGDGLLTVLVEDGGVTESITRRIPIVLRKVQLSLLPEGGALVQGLPGRVYFEAKNPLGKPADVAGRVRDDLGNVVAEFRSHQAGLGRFELTPATGRSYRAEITEPAGVAEAFQLPLAEEEGCALRAFDDLDGKLDTLRVAVRCSRPRQVVVAAVLREMLLDAAAVQVPESGAAVVYLKDAARLPGVARVTVFADDMEPMAERLVFRNRRARLNVAISPDRTSYRPRDEVTLTVRTTGADGRPLPADVALSVVDDTLLSFADDKQGDLLARLLLQPEIPGELEEPNAFLDLDEPRSALALDLLMGTRGYRRFEWRPVLFPPPPAPPVAWNLPRGAAEGMWAMAKEAPMRMLRGPVPAAMPPPLRAGPVEAQPVRNAAFAEVDAERREPKVEELALRDEDWAKAKKRLAQEPELRWVKGRVFPAPRYDGPAPEARTDFRDTVHWAPAVRTGRDGSARVRFFLSDAVTSFRVVAEGVGGGLPGRGEAVLRSSLPFDLSLKLPLEVSQGDELRLPVSLGNATDRALDAAVDASFGELVRVREPFPARLQLGAGERVSRYPVLEVTGVRGISRVRVAARAGGLSDAIERDLVVTPLGFPQELARSGELEGVTTVAQDVDTAGAMPGTVTAELRVYPSPVATMLAGLDGMLQQPGGCFEQTSSTNYPNVMVLQYLQQNGEVDPAITAKATRLLEGGYKLLSGYESPRHGYEWFGGDPGHEALTAYGLLEFADMKQVFPEVDAAMVARTAGWLKSRRDGKGGFQRDAKALDSFGRASPEVTDAYITSALATAGYGDLPAEVERQAHAARETQDGYLLALATNTLLHVPARRAEGRAAADRLVRLQDTDGAFRRADHSITRSTGINLHVETTALATLALLEAGGHDEAVRGAVGWLQKQRGAMGNWNATQATVLALKALTAYANASRRTPTPGEVTVLVDGKAVAHAAYAAGRREPLILEGLPLDGGKHRVEVQHRGGGKLPYTLAVAWRTAKPASSAEAVVALSTALARDVVEMGESVRLTATVTNRTAQGQPMTLARVGIPAGLAPLAWQLKELKEKGAIAFFETRPREVILYFRDLKPAEVKSVPLDLTAVVPGRFTAPASSAYLYYADEHRSWAPGLQVEVRQ